MKRILAINCFALFLLCSFFMADAMAVGLGFNVSAGSGSTDWEAENWWDSMNDFDFDTDDSRRGFGFIFDTTVAKDRLFNYRLNIGTEAVDYETEGGSTFETSGWFMAHDFGFGIIRKKALRLWVGPELRISYSEGELDTNKNWEMDMLSMGLGPVLGLNLNFGKVITLAFKVGALSMSSVGTLEFDDPVLWDEWDIEGSGSYTFANVGLIFRLGDNY